MSLRTKMLTILVITWSVILAVIIFGSYAVILADYEAMEKKDIAENYIRAKEALARMGDSLNALTTDWAHWNDSYIFLKDKNQKFIEDNLASHVPFKDMEINFILFFADNGKFFYGTAYDLEKNKFIHLSPSLLDYISKQKLLVTHENFEISASGFIKTSEGYIFLASYPVTDSTTTAKPNGNLIMGYFFNSSRIKKLEKTLQTKLDLIPMEDIHKDPITELAAKKLLNGISHYSISINENIIYTFSLIYDVEKKPIGLFRFSMERTTYQEGLSTIKKYLLMVSITGLIILFVVSIFLQYFVLNRIMFFKKQLQHITSMGDFSQKITISGNDEITNMVESSNEMLTVINNSEQKLNALVTDLKHTNIKLNEEINEHIETKMKIQELNEQLLSSARRAGMAEVATSVLHNVGNVLNSLNVSATILRENLKKSKFLNSFNELNKVVKNSDQHIGKILNENSQGVQFIKYFDALTSLLKEEKNLEAKELTSLLDNIQHIKEIIMTQQTLGGISGTVESISIPEQINAAIYINGFNSSYIIEREYNINHPVVLDKIKLMQILVNLIRNAKDALKDSSTPQKKIMIVVNYTADGMLQISISDNGIGIAPENIEKIFNFGFTTKKDGHGFGSHHSALLAKELGGKLNVISDGLGKGATFTLEIPAALGSLQ